MELRISSEGNVPVEIKNKIVYKILFTWGQLIVTEIQRLIEEMGLVSKGGGTYKTSIHSYVTPDNVLNIEDGVFYGAYLEYGTLAYWQEYGLKKFPSVVHPKKMDMPAKMKKSFPKGMQPFAPFRRVLYNNNLMETLFLRAVKNEIPTNI